MIPCSNRRWIVARDCGLLAVGLFASSASARADGGRIGRTVGIAVVAVPGATDAAWPLAQAVYANTAIRPSVIDEQAARILCGLVPASDAPADLRDLASDVAALRGDDAPSRALLADISRRVTVVALVVVWVGPPHPAARVFLAESQGFDAATYAPDAGATLSWASTTQSLARAYGTAPLAAPTLRQGVPFLAVHEGPRVEKASRQAFYESPWFWAGLAAAAAAGGAFYLARDNGPTMLHLQLNAPQ